MKQIFRLPRVLLLSGILTAVITPQVYVAAAASDLTQPLARPALVSRQTTMGEHLEGSETAKGQYPDVVLPRERHKFRLPLAQPTAVIHYFSSPQSLYGPGNRGVDFATTAGTKVYAPAAAVVSFCGEVAQIPTVALLHAGGIKTTYQPVHCTTAVGTSLQGGEEIGIVTNQRNGHLHWGAKLSRLVYFDPLRLLVAPVVLIE